MWAVGRVSLAAVALSSGRMGGRRYTLARAGGSNPNRREHPSTGCQRLAGFCSSLIPRDSKATGPR